MITWSLLGLAVIYAVLSFLMAAIIWRLPIGYVLYDPTAYWHIVALAVIFLFALPGQMWLDRKQRRARLLYWEREGLPDELRLKPLYLSDAVDQFCEWWERKKLKAEVVNEAISIIESGSDSDNNYHIVEIAD